MMTIANTHATELLRIENRFRKLFYRFYMAQGNLTLRRRLAKEIIRLRDQLCVAKEQFKSWFRRTYRWLLGIEHVQIAPELESKTAECIMEQKLQTSPFAQSVPTVGDKLH